jgi:P27 family predicted phage terminase small subunit
MAQKKKPLELVRLEGDRSHGKRPKDVVKPPPSSPEPPDWLHDLAKREWYRILPILENLGLMTDLDVVPLAAYCQAYARLQEVEAQLDTEGFTKTSTRGSETQSTSSVAAKQYMQIIRGYCMEFGLTPSARGRMQTPNKQADESELESLISSG